MSRFEAVVGAKRSIARVTEVLGAEDTAQLATRLPSSTADYLRDVRGMVPAGIRDGAGTLAGAAAGAILVGNHRVLGTIGGASLGRNLPAIFDSATRREALCNMGQTGVGIVGSLLMPNARVAGFLVGWLAGGIGVHFGNLRGEVRK